MKSPKQSSRKLNAALAQAVRFKMQHIVKFVFITIGLLSSSAFATNGYVANVDCNVRPNHPSGVERIRLTSIQAFSSENPPVRAGLTLFFRGGEIEFLSPIEVLDPFGDIAYAASVDFVKGRLYFVSSQVGEIFLAYQCHHSPGVPWERCRSQGTGEHGRYSWVALNLEAHLERFEDENLCGRSVTEY